MQLLHVEDCLLFLVDVRAVNEDVFEILKVQSSCNGLCVSRVLILCLSTLVKEQPTCFCQIYESLGGTDTYAHSGRLSVSELLGLQDERV